MNAPPIPGRKRWLAMTSTLVLAGAAHHASGCGVDAADCSLGLTCPGCCRRRQPAG